MMYRDIPHFVVKKNLQKSASTGIYFSDMVTPEILRDVCTRITGLDVFTHEYVDNSYSDEFVEATYNKGRMALMHYKGEVYYITFSEKEIGGRNSSVQSVPTAFNMFYLNPYPRKHLMYYFLNSQGNPETDYHIMMYRLMLTIGFRFLNADVALSHAIRGYASIEDIMFNRKINAGKNKSNNSTYITKNGASQIDIYGKTYGASKYETSMICYALSHLKKEDQRITLYEVLEGDLKELPASSLNVIKAMGNIRVVPTDMQLERKVFEENDSLRSPRYIYNLLSKFGKKKCVLCGCEIPELIQGAHIWPVASIKREGGMTFDQKLHCAIDGQNGLWLCENHHKLFDTNIIGFSETTGKVMIKSVLNPWDYDFLDQITTTDCLPKEIMTNAFCEYLWRRNTAI